MYSFLKKTILAIFSDRFINKNYYRFRFFASLAYRGKDHHCNLCEFGLKRFIKINNNDLLCPNCGSRSRTRRLYKYLIDNNLIMGSVLHFSPPRALFNRLKKHSIDKYYASDFEKEFIADYQFDITKINLPDHSIDLLICYHVLEHVLDDFAAMKEIKRVLKIDGKALIQTPFKDGEIYEDSSITDPNERELEFGQSDHVRIYSKEGLKKRLTNAGLQVQILNFQKTYQKNFIGLTSESILLVTH